MYSVKLCCGKQRRLKTEIVVAKREWQRRQSLSPRVAVSLGEPILERNIGWTRRGVPFWEDNRSEGAMVPSWRDPDLLPMGTMVFAVGQGAAEGALPAIKKLLLAQHTLIILKVTLVN